MQFEQDQSLAHSWAIQRRVLGALFAREILTRYGRHNIGFLWLFIEPMMFTLGVTALWSATDATHGSSLPIAAFALTGYSSVLLWRNMPSRAVGAVRPNLALLYHRYVKAMDVFAARLVLEGMGATTSFVVLSLFFIFIGLVKPPEDVLMVAFGWIMLAWFGAALALLLGAWAEESEIVDKLWHPASYLLFPLSGAAFSVDALPQRAQEILLYLPMVHGVEMVREGYFGSLYRPHYDAAYMALVNLGLSFAALAVLWKVSGKIVPE
jgi:ABC-type polysaccharide/polyol phosphate export permease